MTATQHSQTSKSTLEPEGGYRWRWSAAQLSVVGAGIFLLIIGGIALARLGAVGLETAVDPDVTVAIWKRTPLMAGIEMALGITLIVSGAQKVLTEGAYRVLGAIMFAFGIVLLAQPASFDAILGASRNTGWLYAVVGGGLLGIGFGPPVVRRQDRTVAAETDGGDRPGAANMVPVEADTGGSPVPSATNGPAVSDSKVTGVR